MQNNSVYSINIERAVLSAIFFNGDEIYTAKDILNSKDFYLPAHQKIFEAMMKLHNEDMPIDEEFLRKRLDSKDVDDSVLIEILSANPISNTKAYVKEIKDGAIKRDLASLATTIKKVTIEDEVSASEAIATIESELYKITDTSKSYKSRSISDVVQAFKEKHQRASQPDTNKKLVKLGIPIFDNKFRIAPGTLVIIGARPSMGKSSLAFQIANKCIKDKLGTVIDSLEMPAEDVILRMIAQENQENITDLLNGLVEDFNKFNETLKKLSTSDYLHIDDKVLTFNQLKSKFLKIKRQRAKKGLPTDVWILDHVGYVKTDLRWKREELSAGSKMLKELAKELGITIIALSQLNRSVTERKGNSKNRPQLSDLKDTGSLEEDGDIIIFPHRDSYYQKAEKNEMEADVNDANILVLKNRNGPCGVVNTYFKGSTNSFGYFPVVEVAFESNDTKAEVPYIDMG